jgi:FixJ family two-component response regulator
MTRAVCIVDSDASVRDGLSRVVESAGYEVRRFASVEAFVGGTQALGAACAVVDLTDAASGTPAIRARLMVVASLVPMIVLSTRDGAQTVLAAREFGARAFFRKPVDAAALVDSIGWIQRRSEPG